MSDGFLYIQDVFTPDDLSDLIAKHGRPKVILNDHMTLVNTLPSDIQGIFLPLYASSQASLWKPQDFEHSIVETQNTFCVMSNKKTLSRSLCLRMIEILGFKNFIYTWSGLGRSTDMSVVIDEMDTLGRDCFLSQDQRNALLAPIEMPANTVGDFSIVADIAGDYGGNRNSWDQGLDKMFHQSAISLITETYVPTREAVFTEKTIYSVLGLNFPIWVGGFGQAEVWKKFGFDTFDDIINHGYQYMPTLVERCWHSLYLNRSVLYNFDLACDARKRYLDRLIRNRDLLLSGRLLKYSFDLINLMPLECQPHVRKGVELVCDI